MKKHFRVAGAIIALISASVILLPASVFAEKKMSGEEAEDFLALSTNRKAAFLEEVLLDA